MNAGKDNKQDMDNYQKLDADHPIKTIGGFLVSGTEADDLISIGSAFLVAPRVALTARHVVDDICMAYHQCTLPDVVGNLRFAIDFAQERSDGHPIKWHVMAYGYSNSIDIAALILEPSVEASGHRWITPEMSLRPPETGDRVHIFGYPKSSRRVPGSGEAIIGIDPRLSEGRILEVHEQYRDSVMLPFPCARTSARIDGGMSGGPVFNDMGQIVGLATASLQLESDLTGYDSYVSLIWPALGLTLRHSIADPSERVAPYFLKEVPYIGGLSANELQRVSIEHLPDTEGKNLRLTLTVGGR